MKKEICLLTVLGIILSGCEEKEYIPKLADFQGLRITEVAANADKPGAHSWVEIQNTSSRDINLYGVGLYLSDGQSQGKEISMIADKSIKAGHRMVLSTADYSLSEGISSDSDFELVLGMSADKDIVDSFNKDELGLNGQTGRYGSYQEIPEGSGEWKITSQATRRMKNIDAKPNAIWVWSTHMDKWIANDFAELKRLKGLGYDHVLLNYYSFDEPTRAVKARQIIAKAREVGMLVHAWLQVFNEGGNWVNPVEDLGFREGRYKQEEYDRIIDKANGYIDDFGVDGIHLDYIRFPGTGFNQAHRWSFDNGVTGEGAITEFCKQLRESLDARADGVMITAALMSQNNPIYYYGQNAAEMGKYLDVLMPMAYKYYSSHNNDDAWLRSVCDRFLKASEASGAQVWAGIQTYCYQAGVAGEIEMTPDQVMADARVVRGTDCSGIVLFRYDLGDFPDLNEFWK